ncbi:hypothetical protein STCU_08845 [Strigomonas culicis]|uniref:Uncharacterized protein n=1 Tax=Strigomonas culicis TaxID=28005 RepID=S9TVZ5_9TRYP|nr:hypothetical protein STCU_08845 [Strigomonas culicis]|eukprot:EPY20763.1 hypothetical protein STCU_08845 [Strigomonas culicis]
MFYFIIKAKNLLDVDRSAVDDINTACSFFVNLNYPANPLPSHLRGYFDKFFGGNGLITFCDKLFGTYHQSVFGQSSESACWMDIANLKPNGSVAAALDKFLSPGKPFMNLLEAFSLASPNFSSSVKTGWKSSDGKEQQVVSNAAHSIDFPLFSLFPNSSKLLGETHTLDLYNLSRSACSPLILVPFWYPPLQTRTEQSQKKLLTSLPCSPMGYFILRLFFYIVKHSEKKGGHILSLKKPQGVLGYIGYYCGKLGDCFGSPAPVEFVFLNRLLASCAQYYVSTGLLTHVKLKASLTDMVWTIADVMGFMLLWSPSFILDKSNSVLGFEGRRAPCHDAAKLSAVMLLLPMMSELFVSLMGKGNMPVANPVVIAELRADTTARMSDSIMYSDVCFYQNCLVALRVCVLSMEGVPHLRCHHFNNCLELWLTLMNPKWRTGDKVDERYVLHHMECYTVITKSMFELLWKSSTLRNIDHAGSILLFRCFEIVASPLVQNMLKDISQNGSNSSILPVVIQHHVLNWSPDELTRIFNINNDQMDDMAARAYVTMEGCDRDEVNESIRVNLRKCLEFIQIMYPKADMYFEKWKQSLKTETEFSFSTVEKPREVHILSDEEKSAFFKGNRANFGVVNQKIRLATNNGRVAGGHHPSLNASFHDEIPALVAVSRFLDCLIRYAYELYYASSIPTCEKGHRMWLLQLPHVRCSKHPSCRAIWECAICESVYGACCTSFPLGLDGAQLQVCESRDPPPLCAICGELLQKAVCYRGKSDSGEHYCTYCASRPFKPFSTRFLAAYRTSAILLMTFVVYFILRMLFF